MFSSGEVGQGSCFSAFLKELGHLKTQLKAPGLSSTRASLLFSQLILVQKTGLVPTWKVRPSWEAQAESNVGSGSHLFLPGAEGHAYTVQPPPWRTDLRPSCLLEVG